VGSRRRLVVVALAASLITVPSSAGAASGRHKLRAFASCSNFVHYARRHAPKELRTRGIPEPIGLPVTRSPQPMTDNGVAQPEAKTAPTTGGAGQDFSTTNVQEAGVDEPDQVKTDGKTLFVVENQTLFALDVRSDPPKLLDSLSLDTYGAQLLLDGDKLLVMAGSPIVYALGDVIAPPVAEAALAPIYPTQQSTLTLVDVSKPSAMKVEKTMSVNGGYLTARMTDHSARVVFSATPRVLPALQRAATPDAPRPNVRRTTTPDWRPSYRLRRGRKGKIARHALVRCTAIEYPQVFSGLNSLTVLTIDLKKGLDPVDSDAVMTDGQTVYASTNNLYVATQRAIVEKPESDTEPPALQTEIHKFDISKPDETTYEGSGVVSGTVLNQYAMSEQDGFLRVATTEEPLWWRGNENRKSESFVTVLKQEGSSLVQVGRVGGLGKGERIYAVRFIGDTAYVVTFRQIDPLYTVGLSDPEHPKVLGELELLGYSAYLHPVGDGLLLGVGQSVGVRENEPSGTQVSLFDVSDPANPKRLSNAMLESGSSSSAEFDPHAFLWWDPLKLAVLPVQVYSYEPDSNTQKPPFIGAIGFTATKADGVKEKGRLSQPDSNGYSPEIDRTLVVGDRLFTVSYMGLMASDLGSFASRGFVAFPQPQPQQGGVGTSPPSEPVASPPAK
jgi:uncharacterized secreted protein with C-terminal beta-propeller domain